MNNSIELTKGFYDKSAIAQAIAAYKEIATIILDDLKVITIPKTNNPSVTIIIIKYTQLILV